ncbi:PREDICTED: uncharacterized protein LOC104803348 [Tarenaya hassleriana]|uniref:uncharacterized protein LOC104803348 n=1 Tax=Tarenaya hassleriana TaxID=28532 RepID=UPI00053C9F8B|nr:PREDICTED: uncharacterized protein LOC104803348 [Tarenaya hassleriana]
MGIRDIPHRGTRYTWCNSHTTDPLSIKLDWAMGNVVWREEFPSVYAEFASQGPSDHSPCIIHYPPSPNQHPLKALNASNFSQLSKRVKEATEALARLQERNLSNPSVEQILEERSLRAKMMILVTTEERFYRQNQGQRISSPELIRAHAIDYYSSMLGERDGNIRTPAIEWLQDLIEFRYQSENYEELVKIPTEEDIKQVIFLFPDNKAPGPDGYPKEFFTSA